MALWKGAKVNLKEYCEQEDALSLREIAEKADVSYTTVKSVRKGMRVKLYDVAKRISEATGGEVSIKELCEGGNEE